MDLSTTIDGDIFIDGTDIVPLSLYDTIGQRINHVLRSKPGDWDNAPTKGAYLQQYVGYPNIPSTKRLVEKELYRELTNDEILGLFDITVFYTPVTMDSAVIEIKVKLPDGSTINTSEILKTSGSLVGREEPIFTSADYNFNTLKTVAEYVQLEEKTNIIETKHLPINSNIFILSQDELSSIDTNSNGFANFEIQTSGSVLPINFEVPWNESISGIVPYILTSGITVSVDDTPIDPSLFTYDESNLYISGYSVNTVEVNVQYDISGVQTLQQLETDYDTRQYTIFFNTEMSTILENSQVESMIVIVDGVQLLPSEYSASSTFIKLNNYPTQSFEIQLNYYDTVGINNVVQLNRDIKPKGLFSRSRSSKRFFLSTKNMFDAGTYFVQYTTGSIGINNA